MDSRISLFNFFKKEQKIIKIDIIGQGEQGVIYKYKAEKKRKFLSLKKFFITKDSYKYINNQTSKNALKIDYFIEKIGNELLNILVLEKICPHFPLYYSYEVKKRIGVCKNDFPYKGIYKKEYVYNSQNFTEWLSEKKRNQSILENIYFQLFTALYTMDKYFDMKHMDLHPGNILIQKITPGGYWQYNINGQKYYIENKGYLLYVIDFGQIFIEKKTISEFSTHYNGIVYADFDLKTLYDLTEKYYFKKFDKFIKNIIDDLKYEEWDITYDLYWNKFLEKPEGRRIQLYNTDKVLNKTKYSSLKKFFR